MGNQSGKHQNPHKFRQRRHGSWRGVDTPFPPGKPYLPLDLDSAPDLITIRWDKPFKDGGAPISGYLIEHRRVGSPHWVKAAPSLVQAAELTIGGLEPGWRYQFRVFAENVAGLSDPSELSEPLTVTLQRAAITAPRFTQDLRDTVALENEKVEFVVYFLGQPPPKVCWFKDGFEIFSSRRTRILTEADRSVLTFYQSALCDEGEIKCSATNKAGHASTKANLKLESPPSVRLPRQYEEGLLFEIGEVMRLKVSVAGLPTPLIYWSHNGETMTNNERFIIENSEQTSMLRINEATRNDRGEYQIKAVNRLGQSVASFLVTITDKPSPPGKAKVVMTLGKSVTLQWHTPEDDGGCKIGNYIVEYYRMGWNVWLKAATSRQLTTMLGDLIEGSEYKFRIKAESPYGVSEPSEESEVIFIPDSKRGIMKPDARSRSQPREIDEIITPVAYRRKNKPQPRSFSSPRTEEDSDEEQPELSAKIEPKIAPELPPKITERKPVKVQTKLNKDIFDRASMAREFAYGSPEIRVKKGDVKADDIAEDLSTYKPSKQLQDSIRSTKITMEKNKSPSPAREVLKPPVIIRTLSDEERSPTGTLTPRTNLDRNKFSRENSENLGGSSEYMLVLYPEEEHREFDVTGIDFSNTIAPPLSLSAPELGTEFPALVVLRLSASSTELLHERALVRFYQEALAEEEDMKRRRDHDKSPIPKIQINSQENDDIVGLERKHSLRRKLSAGGTVPNQLLWTQKRHSLRNSGDLCDVILEGKLYKNMTVEEKRLAMANRQRSESEEREEEEFERVRQKMATVNPVTHKKKISVVAEEVWDDEDDLEHELIQEKDEIISLSDSASSIDDRWNLGKRVMVRQVEDEDDTYHPSMRSVLPSIAPQEVPLSPTLKSKYEEPFEILTKPVGLPDPNFVPKPILKKQREPGDPTSSASEAEQHSNVPSSRSSSVTTDDIPAVKTTMPEGIEKSLEVKDINVVASISGMTAVGPILAHPLLQKRVEEEQKVVIDHYGDIVKSYSQRSRTPSLTTSSILDKYAKQGTDEVIIEPEPEPEPLRKIIEPLVKEKSNSLKRFDERMQKIESKVNSSKATASGSDKAEDIQLEHISAFARNNGRLETREPRRPRMASPSPMRGSKLNPMLAEKIPIMQPMISKPEIKVVETRQEIRSTSKARTGTRSRSTTRSSKPTSRSNSSTQTADISISTSTDTGTDSGFLRKPRMCEIMTQTSTNIDPYPKLQPKAPSIEEIHLKVLEETAQHTVRRTVDYVTDLAMFSVASWFFLFSNELYAIPVLGILVFRQVKEALPSLVPKWIKRRVERRRQAAALKRRMMED